jgi:hypothetical protein
MIIRLVYFFARLRLRDEAKIKNQSKQNKYADPSYDTGTTTEANEPIEVDDDVSHETSENKEQGKFQSCWASLYTWLRYDKDKNKMYCSKCISIGANNTVTAVYCLVCLKLPL